MPIRSAVSRMELNHAPKATVAPATAAPIARTPVFKPPIALLTELKARLVLSFPLISTVVLGTFQPLVFEVVICDPSQEFGF